MDSTAGGGRRLQRWRMKVRWNSSSLLGISTSPRIGLTGSAWQQNRMELFSPNLFNFYLAQLIHATWFLGRACWLFGLFSCYTFRPIFELLRLWATLNLLYFNRKKDYQELSYSTVIHQNDIGKSSVYCLCRWLVFTSFWLYQFFVRSKNSSTYSTSSCICTV